MSNDVDEHFFNRADAVIHLANEQAKDIPRGQVSASCMYGTARFNAWVSACGHDSAEGMIADREEILNYFTQQYRAMLAEHLDDYTKNFARYMEVKSH